MVACIRDDKLNDNYLFLNFSNIELFLIENYFQILSR